MMIGIREEIVFARRVNIPVILLIDSLSYNM